MLNILLISTIFATTRAKPEFPCCIVHESEGTCLLEEGMGCTWLISGTDDDAIQAAAGIPCVSTSWYDEWVCLNTPGCVPPPNKPPPPVPPPSSECVMLACTSTTTEYNIAFLIDESGSVGRTNYLISLDFIKKMVENDIQPNAPISMLAFASGLDRIYHFTDSQHDQRAGALAALSAERNDYNSGSTCTATAIREAINEFSNTPGITPASNNLLFLMTDGQPNCGGNVCDERAALVAAGIKVYIVGVGSGFTAGPVSCLTDGITGPTGKNVDILDVPGWHAKDFYKVESQLRSKVCDVIFEEEESNLFVDATNIISNANNMTLAFWCMIIGFVIFGIGWIFRSKICERNGKYKPLLDNSDGFESIQTAV